MPALRARWALAARCPAAGAAVVVGLLEDLERPASRLAGADHDVDVDRLALLDVGRDRHLLDQHLAVVRVLDRQHVDLRRPSDLAVRACSKRLPRFSLPSESMTIRRAVSSGKVASASLRAAARSVFSGSIGALDAQQVELARGGGTSTLRLLAEDHHAGQVVLPAASWTPRLT